jgi:hypothetical protein
VVKAGNKAVARQGGAQIYRGRATEGGNWSTGESADGSLSMDNLRASGRWLLGQGNKFLIPDQTFQAANRLQTAKDFRAPQEIGRFMESSRLMDAPTMMEREAAGNTFNMSPSIVINAPSGLDEAKVAQLAGEVVKREIEVESRKIASQLGQ